MASQRVHHVHLFVPLLAILLFSLPARSDEEDDILQGLNSYRRSSSVPPFAKNDKADCLADEIADKLDGQPCPLVSDPNTLPTSPPQFSSYPGVLKKCKVDVRYTKEGAILPVCVKNRVPTLVLTNYTQTPFSSYLNNSLFTGVGIGKEDDWIVVILSTNTPAGSLASAATFTCKIFWVYYFVPLLGLLLVLVD